MWSCFVHYSSTIPVHVNYVSAISLELVSCLFINLMMNNGRFGFLLGLVPNVEGIDCLRIKKMVDLNVKCDIIL